MDCVKAFFRSIRESPVETLQTAEFRVRRDDGSWCVLEASGRNLLHDPHVHGIVITSRDVTEKRTAEAELRRALDAAEAANRAKTEFLAIVSHEIRTPMNGVINMAELLLADPLTPSQREEVEVLQNSAKSLSGLIDDLLDLTRAQSGRLALDSAPFDLVRVAREVVRILSPSAAKKRVVVDLDVGEGIPPRIVGDATRVRQVLTNLVGNGIKFTSAGRVILKVSAANAAAGRTRIEIAVSDTGIGLTADQIEKLFQRFTQADPSTRRRFGGTGLGLAISKELVESMGGSIAVESVPGAGTKFSVTIDFEDGAEGPTSAPGNAAEGATAPGPRILAVERDAGSLEIVTRPLRRLGFAVDQARAPEEALRALEHGPYDLVLLDCDEDLDASCAAIREFRSREAGETRTAVVALLSTTSEVDRRRCIASGMDEVLAKPFTPKQLRSAVQRHVVRPVAGPLRATA